MRNNYLIADEIIFEEKPDAVPYNYRISYKIAQLCLIIELCCRGGCSLLKFHMISIGLSTNKDMKMLKDFAYNISKNYVVVRFEPAVNHAVRFAIADGIICQQRNGLFKLTKEGKKYVKGIIKDATLMNEEKKFLSSISTMVTEDKIKALTSLWRYSSAKN